jgi:hypothetical protein
VESKWKNYHNITFLDSILPVMETNVRCFLCRQNNLKVKYSPPEPPEGNVFRGDHAIGFTARKRQRETEVTSQNQARNVGCKDLESKREASQFEKGFSEVRWKGQGEISSGDYTSIILVVKGLKDAK